MKNTLVDLFAGCGGFTEGFKTAGFKSVLAVEMDEWGAATYAANHPKTKLIRADIRKVRWGAHFPSSAKNRIDGIIGGPPCQGFSQCGKWNPKDKRNSLFMEFVRALKHVQPKVFVMENVPGLLPRKKAGKKRIIDIILRELSSAGYKVSWKVLNAADFGVPQVRKRLIIIGLRKDLPCCKDLLFPRPFMQPKEYITVDEVTSDLPQINACEGRNEYQKYPMSAQNPYQKWARKGSAGVFNHEAMRHTPRLIARFKTIKPGKCGDDAPPEHSAHQRGNAAVKSGKKHPQNNRRVYGNRPAPTVPASFQSNFIHPHLHRNFTAREGARLQSFPDRYIFKGKRVTMSWEKELSQYKQIGNAVPPLLAKAIALSILRYFDRIKTIIDDGDYYHC